MNIENNILEFGEGLKKQFADLDRVLESSPLTPEQKSAIKEASNNIHDAIGKMDEAAIIKAMESVNIKVNDTH